MPSYNFLRTWGAAMAPTACEWAEELVPNNPIVERAPDIMMLVFDGDNTLKAWAAVWSGSNERIRIGKIVGQPARRIDDDVEGNVWLENHIKTVPGHNRYWLRYDVDTKQYGRFTI